MKKLMVIMILLLLFNLALTWHHIKSHQTKTEAKIYASFNNNLKDIRNTAAAFILDTVLLPGELITTITYRDTKHLFYFTRLVCLLNKFN